MKAAFLNVPLDVVTYELGKKKKFKWLAIT
jgi:hypothetical protein